MYLHCSSIRDDSARMYAANPEAERLSLRDGITARRIHQSAYEAEEVFEAHGI